MQSEIIFFGSFIFFVSLLLAVDLGLFHKKDKVVTLSQAAIMSAVWVTCALAFYFLFSFLICDSIFCCQTIFLHRSRGEQLTLAENNDKHYHSIPDDCSLSDISTQLRGRYDSHRDIFSLFLLRNLQF